MHQRQIGSGPGGKKNCQLESHAIGGVSQVVTAHTMANSNEGPNHFLPLEVDKVH
jgi:hypothetical protein